ncbi:Phosphopyruvate hydratase [Durusdinium trenchii]|uniref:Phosphopyruvate hydratase n=2 Tax=Durusdinium trenchii TaxID=1381693 RepID=A0ABP0Q7K0_9DINO
MANLESCWLGSLQPELCCTSPEGRALCFPPHQDFTFSGCCAEYLQSLEAESATGIPGIECSREGPTCRWLFRQMQTLDVSNIVAVREFCWAGLSRAGLYPEMLHTEAFNRRLAHLSCFAGMASLLSMCAVAESATSCATGIKTTSTHAEDPALSFFMVAFRSLAMVSHCIDASDWPMTVAEFSVNFQLFVEHGCGFQWLQPPRGLPFIQGVSGETLHDGAPPHRGIQNHAEVHMRINWAMGAWDNRMYWEEKMLNKQEQLLNMKHKDPQDFCNLLAEMPRTDRARQVRVLILGTGPVAAQREFRCKDGVISTVSCDAFSRLYRQLAKETGFQPPHGFPEYCDVEELWQIFPKDYFHVVYVSNALDHTVHPLRSLKWLLWVLHPIGKLQLRHFRNVHPERWTALSDGQHQWGFDVDYGSGGEGSFLIWNHLHRWNVTEELEKDGARTLTHFQKPFVEVEVRKTSNFKGGLHT